MQKKVPSHVALVMAGSLAWADQHGLARAAAVESALAAVERAVAAATAAGVRYLTLLLYEPAADEAVWSALASRLSAYALGSGLGCTSLTLLDDPADLPAPLYTVLSQLQARVKARAGAGPKLSLGLRYRGRQDLVRAARRLATEVAAGRLLASQIDQQLLQTELATASLPAPDLIIRTTGQRLIDALTFEAAYAELAFFDAPWPLFTGADLSAALADFGQRERRFGKTSEQLQAPLLGSWGNEPAVAP